MSDKSLAYLPCDKYASCGISIPFGKLFPSQRQVTHALLTRPPLNLINFLPKNSVKEVPFDLHVLGTPPAFILSQDQTLMLKCLYPSSKFSLANFKPFYCFVRFCSECSHSWSKPKTIFIRIFRVLHTVQFSRNFVSLSLSFSVATYLFYHTVSGLSRTF